MTTKVSHGRRQGQARTNSAPELRRKNGNMVGLTAQGIDTSNVVVFQPKDWKRIQDSLTQYNREAEEAKARAAERERLHETSKNLVKHWENTIEGQRLKKLQSRKTREEKEEEERKQLDIEEARLQAQKRKEAIDRAKTIQYYQTDRVKGFHGALLLTEVLKERDAQINVKKGKKDWEKEKDEQLHRLAQRELEEGINQDQEKALARYNKKQTIAQFQLLQVNDRIVEEKKYKQNDVEEGKNIKEQVEMYDSAKKAISEQRRKDKMALMESYKEDVAKRKAVQTQDIKKEEQDDQEIRKFVQAKKKMTKMRKGKEQELFQAFQNHTERMRQKLESHMQQKVDDEDERIAKAVAERELKRLKEDQKKEEEHKLELEGIAQQRKEMMKLRKLNDEAERKQDEELLKMRVKSDNLFQLKVEEDRQRRVEEAKKFQVSRKEQMNERQVKETDEKDDQLDYDQKNEELLVKEEQQFQEYATKVISEAKQRGRNAYPLTKAAQAGPGGGRGPTFEGKAGLKPSYPASDATGVQLPYYSKDQETYNRNYGHVGKSGNRLGFNW